MSKLRITAVVEYDVNPQDYDVTTIEEAAEEERAALKQDPLGTIVWLFDESTTYTVEVVE